MKIFIEKNRRIMWNGIFLCLCIFLVVLLIFIAILSLGDKNQPNVKAASEFVTHYTFFSSLLLFCISINKKISDIILPVTSKSASTFFSNIFFLLFIPFIYCVLMKFCNFADWENVGSMLLIICILCDLANKKIKTNLNIKE